MANAMPPIFVISLARETERRETMQRELASWSLDFEFFEAIDGLTLAEASYGYRMQDEWWHIMRGRQFSPGEIGCFLSHYALWRHLVETGARHAIVLEDDARLEAGFPAVVDDLMKVGGDWDIVMLSPKRSYRVDREIAALAADRRLVRFARRVAGAVGYLIRLEAAEDLLHYCWRIRAPIDWLYPEWWRNGLRVYAVLPAIVRHAGLPSTIQPRTRVKRTALEHAAAASHRWADRLHLRAARLYD